MKPEHKAQWEAIRGPSKSPTKPNHPPATMPLREPLDLPQVRLHPPTQLSCKIGRQTESLKKKLCQPGTPAGPSQIYPKNRQYFAAAQHRERTSAN